MLLLPDMLVGGKTVQQHVVMHLLPHEFTGAVPQELPLACADHRWPLHSPGKATQVTMMKISKLTDVNSSS